MSLHRLPDNATPIWSPQDSVDTAQAFNAELRHAERGSRLFSKGRHRKAARMDALAVTLLMVLMMFLGAVVWAASAKAEPSSTARAYAAEYGPAVCSVLADGNATTDGLIGIMQAITEQGLTRYEAGEVVGISVTEICPQYVYLLRAFITKYKGTLA